VLHEAIRLLRLADLGRDYAAAWQAWEADEDSADWWLAPEGSLD